eukprot:1145725-Pelagomonas_calceolata.AAC.3
MSHPCLLSQSLPEGRYESSGPDAAPASVKDVEVNEVTSTRKKQRALTTPMVQYGLSMDAQERGSKKPPRLAT